MIRDTNVAEGLRMIPAAWLDTVAVNMKVTGVEWRVLALVIAAGPLPATSIAARLRMRYTNAKRAVRELVRCQLVTRMADGVMFQPDSERWGSRATPATRPSITGPSNAHRLPVPYDDEEVTVQ